MLNGSVCVPHVRLSNFMNESPQAIEVTVKEQRSRNRSTNSNSNGNNNSNSNRNRYCRNRNKKKKLRSFVKFDGSPGGRESSAGRSKIVMSLWNRQKIAHAVLEFCAAQTLHWLPHSLAHTHSAPDYFWWMKSFLFGLPLSAFESLYEQHKILVVVSTVGKARLTLCIVT